MKPIIKNHLIVAVPMLVTIALWLLLLYFSPIQMVNESKPMIIIYGTGKLILILGFIVYVIFSSWQLNTLAMKQAELDKTELEINFRKDNIEKQMEDAEKRRQHDRLLHHDIAIARILESATIKKCRYHRTRELS